MANNDNISGNGFDYNLDTRLLGKDGDSDSLDKAGALNEARRNEVNNEDVPANEPATLREAVIAEKRKKEKEEKEQGGGLKQAATAPMRAGTSKLLQDAWIYLIPSWGLTLIWINIHAFLSLVIGKDVFCRLGDEWLDGKFGGANPAKEAALGKKGSEITDKVSGCANLGETMMLVALDLVVIALIFAILMIIGALLKMVENPIEFVGVVFNWIWETAKGVISK